MSLLSQKQEPAPCPREAGHPEVAAHPAPTAEEGKGKAHEESGWQVEAQVQGWKTYTPAKHLYYYYSRCQVFLEVNAVSLILTNQPCPQR